LTLPRAPEEGLQAIPPATPEHFMSQPAKFGLYILEADGTYQPATDDAIVDAAHLCLDSRVQRETYIDSPSATKSYLAMKLGRLEHEVFAVVFLNAGNRVIECREMFRGTVTQTSVYPREVVKEALELNASSVLLCHNHPSGSCEPSRADELLTQTLKSALALIDVHVLDHIIVGGGKTLSFAERGLL
jgi:DNA repair protein RadC